MDVDDENSTLRVVGVVSACCGQEFFDVFFKRRGAPRVAPVRWVLESFLDVNQEEGGRCVGRWTHSVVK